ncbi:unnamed protein product [Ilex paraguariensis]|uniref:Homer protein n=1 Tax=Ilex paraguariensis TaxID=185542 RepID=A0ABC8TIN8_9AQUA
MTTTFNPTWISSPNARRSHPFTERSHFTPLTHRARLFDGALFSLPRTITVKCSGDNNRSDQNEMGSLKDLLSGMVDERVQELLNREENKNLFDGLEKATLRVEMAKRELAEIEKQDIEAKQLRDYIKQLESRASEIAESQSEISKAKVMLEEAERSLGIEGVRNTDSLTETEREAINKNEERWESVKAASISALVGTLAGLPISLTTVTSNPQLILSVAITFVSCALFGVTFRYAIRRDLDNFQLKSGTSAAFGFVKGLSSLDSGSPLKLDADSLLSHAYDGAVHVSENLLIFAFAAVGLDLCIKLRILSPFPLERSAPKADIR